MDPQCIIRKLERHSWSTLAPNFTDYNYRQSWDFGVASAIRVGALSEHVAIEHPEKGLIALADVRIRRLPVIGGGIAYINGGPLVWKKCVYKGETLFPEIVDALVKRYVIRKNFTLRITPSLRGDFEKSALENALVQGGFADMHQKKKTILVDLFQDEAAIRGNFHQKWRNCLNKSEKTNLSIRIGNDYATFQEFNLLFNELISEKKFSVDLGSDFYAAIQKLAPDYDKFIIMLAEHEGKVVAGHVASNLGDTSVYLLGAADKTGRVMNAAYLLQWRAIQLGKAAGCRWYDLGGIDAEINPGVYTFKKRMGGQERTLPGPYQMKPAGAARALLTQLGEKFYATLKPFIARP